MTPPPPDPFPRFQIRPLPKATAIHRIHDRRFPPNGFNPGAGAATRFAPLRPGPDPVPTLYGAETLEGAIFETILHDYPVGAIPGTTMIPWTRVDPVDHSILRIRRPLRLVQLREPDLNRIGLGRGDLISSSPTTYANTVAWALSIHDTHEDADGLQWTSRACDPHWACLLFGDRVDPIADFEVVEHQPIRDSAERLDAVRLACLCFGGFVCW